MGIRDLVIIAIVLYAAFMALHRPWIGVMLWTWISIMNPHRYTWGFAATAPLALIAAASTLLGLLLTRERESPFKGPPVVWLFVFVIWMTASWLMGFNTSADYPLWDRSIKIFFMTFVALMLLHDRQQIMALAWVAVGSLAILGAKGGLFTIASGGSYRVWGPAESFIYGNNEFALALIMTIPLMHFLQLQMGDPRMRKAMSVVMLLCVASALGSLSRGAFIGIIVMGMMFWWRSKRKGGIGVLLVLIVLATLVMLPPEWWERMSTISSYQKDKSAMGRINAWIVAWEVAKHRLFGAGMSYQFKPFFIAFGPYETHVRAAHSIYFQILGNHGFVGLGLWLAMWFSTLRTAGWLRHNARRIPEATWAADLGAMVQVGLIGYAAGGMFLSLAYFDLPYTMLVLVVLARRWVETRGWERDSKLPFLEYAGLRKRRPAPAPPDRANGRPAAAESGRG
jgi:putative inorganic carbon (HCO3(-)) transporter